MHTLAGTMANQHGNGRSFSRDDEDRYRMRDDDERFDRGYGSHWEDRDREGQSGYGAGRSPDDRTPGWVRNQQSWSGSERGTDDRWTGRGGSPWGNERFGQREYGRGGWEQGRSAQGYGYNDSDRPSFERGVAGTRNGLYGGGGYEPVPGPGSRQQNRYGSQGYGESGQSGYRQHQTGLGGTQGLEIRRGPHRGKGPQGFQRSDERVRELVCEALTDDDDVDATHVEVNVKNGEVMLAGTVEDREMKRRAEDCALRVPGVRDVHNQLRIRS